MKLKIAYLNFWKEEDNLRWFTIYLKNNISEIEIINYKNNPDILFCSCMGDINEAQRAESKLKIFFTGENLDRFPPYNNLELLKKTFNILLLFNNTNIQENIIRLPLWVLFYKYYDFVENDNILSHIQKSYNTNIIKKKEFLGSLVARTDFNNLRKILYTILSKYGKILCPSSLLNNCQNIGSNKNDKINFISKGLINICPENSINQGYHTEKIFQAFEGGTIPIYWAVDHPEKELLKNNSYLFLSNEDINNNNIENKINYLINNYQKYIVNELFEPQSIYIIDNYYSTLKWQIKLKLNLIEKQKIYGISYASRRFINRHNIIQDIAQKSNYFDYFKCYKEDDINSDFKNKFKEVWNSYRGGGYWIWKNYLILQKLKEINDNDILIYIDAGCHLNINDTAKTKLNNYINLVNNHWCGLLKFELPFEEHKFTNKYTINYFENKFKIKIDLNKKQLHATIVILRKNKFTIDYFEKINEILYENPYLFTDKYNLQNEQHRHDQSISSLLYKIMGGSLILKDETYFSNENKHLENFYPILAKRLTN